MEPPARDASAPCASVSFAPGAVRIASSTMTTKRYRVVQSAARLTEKTETPFISAEGPSFDTTRAPTYRGGGGTRRGRR